MFFLELLGTCKRSKINSAIDLCILEACKRDQVVRQGLSLKVQCRLNHDFLQEKL